jgi:hypothetical protein
MTPVPLAALRLRPSHHRAALWWLALLYRRPPAFQIDLEQLGRGERFAAAVRMYLHGLPYVVAIAVLGWLLMSGGFGNALDHVPADLADLDEASRRIAAGIPLGIGFGI